MLRAHATSPELALLPLTRRQLLTVLGVISYATEDLFAAGVIALMVGISTLLTVNGSQYLIDCGEEWGPSYRRCGESTPGYRGA